MVAVLDQLASASHVYRYISINHRDPATPTYLPWVVRASHGSWPPFPDAMGTGGCEWALLGSLHLHLLPARGGNLKDSSQPECERGRRRLALAPWPVVWDAESAMMHKAQQLLSVPGC